MKEYTNSLLNKGLSVIPIKTDGSKSHALLSWKDYQNRQSGADETDEWFSSSQKAAAIVTGKVSGSLEVIDIDDATLYEQFRVKLNDESLFGRLVNVRTPRPGYQLIYRCPSGIEGNLKLAVANRDGKLKTLIETRGEGGYICAPECPVIVHSTGKRYIIIQGSLDKIPELTAEERKKLHDTARSFNEIVKPEYVVGKTGRAKGGRPGDDFNERATWQEILEPHSWKLEYSNNGTGHWTKPGSSNPGIHATTDHAGTEYFYVFSTSAEPFDHEKAYSKFAVYALLNHEGNFGAAAAELRRKGYGSITTTDDIGNAERFVSQHGADLFWLPKFGKFFIWNGKHWRLDETGQELAKAAETARAIFSEAAASDDADRRAKLARWAQTSSSVQRIQAMIKLAKSELARKVEELDQKGMLLNCRNGTIDLKTGRLMPHNRDHLITKSIDVDYEPDAPAPKFTKFINDIFEGKGELISYVQRALGYSLTAQTSEQYLFIAHGNGQNGKSTLFECIMDLLGDYAQSAAPGLIIQKKERSATNDLARLAGVRFVTCTETGELDRLDEERVKRLTGGDRITARYLHQEFFDFSPSHKLWLITNHMPEVRGTDTAIWRRLRKIPFLYTVPDTDKDPGLNEKLKEEYEGILAWLVKGCLEWQEQGLKEPSIVVSSTQEYKEEADSVGQFVINCVEVDDTAFTATSSLLDAYKRFSGDHLMTLKGFGRRLTSKGLKSKRKSSGNGFAVQLRQDDFVENVFLKREELSA